jgi:RHH-type proline utilization regulon transcriptional repressor/proline dehydrogenase/delta 1-pyrroline-5-carboxylate dehydrogenase
MGDALHAAIVSMGYPVRIYTPIGELIPGMAYLVRRILENTANESFLRQDLFQERNTDELLAPPTEPGYPAEGGVGEGSAETRSVRPTESPAGAAPISSTWSGEPSADYSREDTRKQMEEALMAVTSQVGRTYPLFIGAEAVDASQTLTARNPARPTEILGHVAMAQRAEVDRAVQMATEAQPRWAATSVHERVVCLRRLAQRLRQQRHELAAWEVFEVGKPWREADADVVEAIDFVEYYSQQMLELAKGPSLRQVPGERNELAYVPRGVAVVIAPWNFPGAIFTGMAAAALVTGNAVILKPAEQSSIIAAYIARLMREAGIPDGVVQFMPGAGEEVGAALVRHPGTHVILFTGSKAVGMSIIDACATLAPGQRFIKHVIAEMGGKNAIVVDADADLDAAIQGTVRCAFGYAGQKCSAASRLIVHREVYDRFLPRLAAATDRLVVGDPSDPDTDMGPLIDEAAQRRLLDAIAHAERTATVAYRYPASRLPPDGYFVGPTLVTDISRQDRLAREELFGPLLCLFRVDSFEEGIALANDTDYALTGGVYSRSPSHLEDAMRAFDVGNLYLNRPITGAMVGRQPFGGHRLSGLGTKAGGPDYLLQLVLPKTICTNTTRHGMPLD